MEVSKWLWEDVICNYVLGLICSCSISSPSLLLLGARLTFRFHFKEVYLLHFDI